MLRCCDHSGNSSREFRPTSFGENIVAASRMEPPSFEACIISLFREMKMGPVRHGIRPKVNSIVVRSFLPRKSNCTRPVETVRVRSIRSSNNAMAAYHVRIFAYSNSTAQSHRRNFRKVTYFGQRVE